MLLGVGGVLADAAAAARGGGGIGCRFRRRRHRLCSPAGAFMCVWHS